MIIVCPTCSSKYSVPDSSTVDGKMVRCSVCGTTWQATFDDSRQQSQQEKKSESLVQQQSVKKKMMRSSSIQPMFFTVVLVSTFSYLFFATDFLHRIPSYYKFLSNSVTNRKMSNKISLSNISHFFTKRKDGIYLTITGCVENISNCQQKTPYLSFNLRTHGEDFANYENPENFVNETWAEKLNIEGMKPSQKVLFETAPRKIPISDLLCTIKVGTNM